MKIILLSLFVLTFCEAKCQSYNNTIPTSSIVQQQSSNFKNLNGQDRKAAFLPLQALLVTKSKNTSVANPTTSITLTKRSEVYSLLGNPDEILSPDLVAYRLGTTSQKCRATIGFDKNNNVLFTSIENCQ